MLFAVFRDRFYFLWLRFLLGLKFCKAKYNGVPKPYTTVASERRMDSAVIQYAVAIDEYPSAPLGIKNTIIKVIIKVLKSTGAKPPKNSLGKLFLKNLPTMYVTIAASKVASEPSSTS